MMKVAKDADRSVVIAIVHGSTVSDRYPKDRRPKTEEPVWQMING